MGAHLVNGTLGIKRHREIGQWEATLNVHFGDLGIDWSRTWTLTDRADWITLQDAAYAGGSTWTSEASSRWTWWSSLSSQDKDDVRNTVLGR